MQYAKAIYHPREQFRLKTRHVLIMGIFCAGGVALSLFAVRIAGISSTAEASQNSAAYSMESGISVGPGSQKILAGLRSADLDPIPVGAISRAFFTAKGAVVTLGGDNIQLFEYPDDYAAQSDTASFEQSASTKEGAWKKSAHLYTKGNVIALYMGNRVAILQALDSTMGPAAPLQ